MKIKANKKLGQNFLKNKSIVKKIVDSANILENELILEIGPGTGALTKELLNCQARVVAVEKDESFKKLLEEEFKQASFNLVISDIREYYSIFLKNNQEGFKIIANIPYYLSSFLIRMIFEEKQKPEEIILMVQKEWAERITQKNQKNNKLAMFAKLFFDTKYLFLVKKENFQPAPKVDSAVIKLTRKKDIDFSEEFIRDFEEIVNASFRQPRKILLSNLKNYYNQDLNYLKIFKLLKLKEKIRPEEVEFETYLKLMEQLKNPAS